MNQQQTNYHNDTLDIATLPQSETVPFTALSSKYPTLSFIENFLFWGTITLVSFLSYKFIPDLEFPFWIVMALLGGTICLSFFAYFSAKACKYALRERDIFYREGLWWKKTTSVSFKRVQHIDISHGPIERKLQIAKIKFFTAGGSSADLSIPGLPKHKAEKLRTHILELADND